MPRKKSKKIFLYIFLFLFIGTLNNKNIKDIYNKEIKNIYVSGLSEKQNLKIKKSLELFELKNLFFLEKIQIEKLINSFDNIEFFSVNKKYPSTLNIELIETKYLAYVIKDKKIFYLGSNGKLISINEQKKVLPYIYGSFEPEKFFQLKKILRKLNFNFDEIEKLFYFPSGRWDIKLRTGILIKLPKNRLEESLNLLIEILKDKNFKQISMIDVRQINQVIINE